MKLRPLQRVPLLITAVVLGLTLFLRLVHLDFPDRIERATYDLRVRAALSFRPPVATNLGFVFIDQESIRAVHDGGLGYKYGLYWPRHVYGRVVQELASQGATAVAFDVVFGELRPDHALVSLPEGSLLESDEYLALRLRQASNVVLAVTPDLILPGLFRTNALAIGDISTGKDSDGVLRRVKPFQVYRRWHPLFEQAQADAEFGIDLRQARVESRRIILPRTGADPIVVPLDAAGHFDVADFVGEQLPAGLSRQARPFSDERVWHMGIVLAAQELKLNLEQAVVEAGRIILQGPGGVERVLPVDADGSFLIDWCIPPADARLMRRPIQDLLAQHRARSRGEALTETNAWHGRLVVIGSAVAGGNDLTDRGATPLLADTLLVSKHWNVANSVITGRFIRRFTLAEEMALILVLGIVSALLTWQLRALPAFVSVAGLALAFVGLAFGAYLQWRIWVPLVLPGLCAVLAIWACLTAWRVVFEQTERRRVKSVFSRIVSPNVVNELLRAEKLSLGGTRREITVFFADVRGFTEFTDRSHEAAMEHIRARSLSPAEAAACIDEQARETLATVNLYLALVADTVKQHNGTLDKYIGDCVMAFWGAPTPNARHALACVRAAIDAQRAIHQLNEARTVENRRLEEENRTRAAAGQPPHSLLPLLSLGSGINTGTATVGLMGSDAHILNYTVFGRDVNVASRLEGVSGRSRIIISAATYQHLRRDDPKLAATCIELPAVEVKGIREAVRIYEVPWRDSATT